MGQWSTQYSLLICSFSQTLFIGVLQSSVLGLFLFSLHSVSDLIQYWCHKCHVYSNNSQVFNLRLGYRYPAACLVPPAGCQIDILNWLLLKLKLLYMCLSHHSQCHLHSSNCQDPKYEDTLNISIFFSFLQFISPNSSISIAWEFVKNANS